MSLDKKAYPIKGQILTPDTKETKISCVRQHDSSVSDFKVITM